MEPTQTAPAGFILSGGGVGFDSVGKGIGHFNMQGRTTRMPKPGSPAGLCPSLANWVGIQGKRGSIHGNPGGYPLGSCDLSSFGQVQMARLVVGTLFPGVPDEVCSL